MPRSVWVWTGRAISPAPARRLVPGDVAGNFDPLLLTTDEATIRRELAAALAGFDPRRRYIANLGHGITPDADPALVGFLVNELRTLPV